MTHHATPRTSKELNDYVKGFCEAYDWFIDVYQYFGVRILHQALLPQGRDQDTQIHALLP